ncbi:hypothetical protein OG225_23870 [Nocardia sp. NBC_01377]|uniref:hypothetical protein n=1 Tax=Nocardia sp. NBC_01377 TaxID=2903595 RepID=UPI00324A269B
MRKRSAMALAVLATATAMTGIMSSAATAAPSPDIAADCPAITAIANEALATSTPLASLPLEESAPIKDAYIGELQGRVGELSTDQGRANVQNFVNALQSASSPADGYLIVNALSKLRSDCA